MGHSCVQFRGTSDSKVTVSNPQTLQMTGDLTLEFWVKPTIAPLVADGVSLLDKKNFGEGAVQLDSSLKLCFLYNDGVNTTPIVTKSKQSISLSTFTHVAVVRDMTAKKVLIYIGGQLDIEALFTIQTITPSNDSLIIGSGSVAGFQGEIAEVRIWGRVRTQAQIELNRDRRLDGNELGLLGYWPLDEGTGTLVEDNSPQKNPGTVGSDAKWVGLSLNALRPYPAMANAAMRHLVKQYGDRHYIYTAMVRHEGTVIGFAMDDERCIYYSVLDLSRTDEQRGELDMYYWSDMPRTVPFSRETTEVGFAVVDNVSMPTIQLGSTKEDNSGQSSSEEIDVFRSSTARLSEAAQFQVSSDGAHIYLFRQSIASSHADALFLCKDGKASALGQRPEADYILDPSSNNKVPLVNNVLLVDRFVLVGNELQNVLEPRYQRSRHKSRPASAKDSLGVQDMDGVPFCEPTQILSMVGNLGQGRFAVEVVPTQVADCRRWQIFAFNKLTQRIDSFNIERSSDGLFNTQGSRYYTSPDVAYQQAVFERVPGKCPFTGQDLIPMPQDGIFAESALSFNGTSNWVNLKAPVALKFAENKYTIALWVLFSKTGGCVFAKGASGSADGFDIWLSSEKKISVTHRGATPKSVSCSTAIELNTFVHFAATYDGTTIRIYLNGVASGSATASFVPGAANVTIGTGSSTGTGQFFGGVVDELRIYRRALSSAEISEGYRYRLIGKEPGLVAYYRFDEGQGTTLYDQSDSAAHGDISIGTTWVTSKAAVADHPGVRRDSFVVSSRALAGGMSARLYYTQNGSAGASHKGQARLLLAFPTSGPNADGSATTNNYLAAIDFAVGRDGRLAAIPDVVQLPFVGVNNPSAQLDQAAAAQMAITRLEEEKAALVASGALAAALLPYDEALAAKNAELTSLSSSMTEDEVRFAVPQLARDPLGLSVSGAILGFAYAGDAPSLHDSARGDVVLYFRGQNGRFFAAYYDTKRARGALALPLGSQTLLFTPRSDGADLSKLSVNVADGTSPSTCKVTITDTSASPRIEIFPDVPRAANRLAAVLSGALPDPVFLGSQLNAASNTATLTLKEGCQQSRPAGSRIRLGNTIATLKVGVSAGATTLTLTAPLASISAGTSIEGLDYDYNSATCNMPGCSLEAGSLLLSCDSGAIVDAVLNGTTGMSSPSLGPAWRSDAPGRAFAFDAATEPLSLASTLDPAAAATPGDLTLEAWLQPANVSSQQRVVYQNSSATNRYTLAVTGALDPQKDVLRLAENDVVDLTGPALGNPDFTIELWIARQQRDKAQTVLEIVGGSLSLSFDLQGYLQFQTSSSAATLPSSVPTVDFDFHHVAVTYKAATRARQIYRDGKLTSADIATQPFAPSTGVLRLQGPLQVDEVRFYNRVLTETEITTGLASPRIGNEAGLLACFGVEDGELRDRGPNRFPVSSLGKATAETVVVLPAEQLSLLAATGGSALELQTANPMPFTLNDKDFTIELWARRQRIDVNECFIEHGTTPVMANSMLQLGFVANKLRFSFYGDTPLDSDIAFSDLDWHHLAFTYSRSSGLRRIFRDGVMVAEKVYATGYAGTGALRIGYATAPSKVTALVDIAEVRIWDCAREQAEILTDHRKKLTGTEAGILALFSFADDDQFRDLGPLKCPINTTNFSSGDVVILGVSVPVPIPTPAVPVPFPVLPEKPEPALATQLSGQSLDGTDDKFDFGSDIVLNDKDFSLEMWIRRPLGAAALVFMHGNPSGASNNTLSFGYSSATQILFSFWDNFLEIGGITADCEWHHLAATFQRGTRTRRVYLDGVERGSDAPATAYQGTGPLVVGWRKNFDYARAEVAELRIWGRVRTQSEIVADMLQALTGSENDLLLLLQQVGGQLTDVGPRRLPATVKGNPQREPVPVVPVDLPLPEGAPLSALRVKVADPMQYIDAGNQLVLNDKDFTVEFWARRARVGTWDPIVCQGGDVTLSTNKFLHAAFTDANKFRFGFGNNDLDSDVYTDLEWHHWACTFKKSSLKRCIYRDGVLVKSGPASAAYAGTGRLQIGAWTKQVYRADADIAEVRIWNRELTQDDVKKNALRLLSGQEDGLIAYLSARGTQIRDLSSSRLPCTTKGSPTYVRMPFPLRPTGTNPPPWNRYQIIAGCGRNYARSMDLFPPYKWSHFAVSHRQSWAVRLAGAAYLDAGKRDSTNLCGDLTIEVFLQLTDTSVEQGVLARGRLADGSGGNVPYHLNIDAGGSIVFRFENDKGECSKYKTKRQLQKGIFYQLAITRKSSGNSTEICIYVNGSLWLNERYEGQPPTGHTGALELGRTFIGSKPRFLRGILSEVRLWNEARSGSRLGSRPRPGESGLAAWWRFEENAGTIAKDSVGENDARLRGAEWTQSPDPLASELRFFANGMPAAMAPIADPDVASPKGFAIGGIPSATGGSEVYRGVMEEVRIFRCVRSEEQILDNLFTRLKGDKQDLIAYYTFDADSTRANSVVVSDGGFRGNTLKLPAVGSATRPRIVLSTAPISNDVSVIRSAIASVGSTFHELIDRTPAVGEYADLQRDPDRGMSGVMKRCYSLLQGQRWHLVTGYKVGSLVTEWVGQAQFAPQLMGYIEGAPPLPSENMTPQALDELEVHKGPSTIRFIQAEEVVQSISASREWSVNGGFRAAFRNAHEADVWTVVAPMGIGLAKSAMKAGASTEVSFGLEMEGAWSSDVETSFGHGSEHVMSATASGYWEDKTKLFNSAIGQRWIPHNSGFALVQSQVADVYALRLAHNNAVVAYRFVPNSNIPRDVNIITFPINPRYTKQGVLDGLVGTMRDPDYQNALLGGEHSYYKPTEAYRYKRQIQHEQHAVQHKYDSFSTNYRASDSETDVSKALSNALGVDMPKIKSDGGKHMAKPSGVRRDLVDTFVWTAEGGLYAESSQSTDCIHETTAGSFSLSAQYSDSFETDIKFMSLEFGFQLETSLGTGFTSTRTRSTEAQRTFELEVESEVPRNLQQYSATGEPQFGADGIPILAPGKVNAFRFMTFYRDARTESFDDFYNKVVDPIWLKQSGDPNAAALRQAQQSDQKPPCWRVFHRVTYVSRILSPLNVAGEAPIDAAMRDEQIGSNYELIAELAPYIQGRTGSVAELTAATNEALELYLPRLVPHRATIVTYLQRYYGIFE